MRWCCFLFVLLFSTVPVKGDTATFDVNGSHEYKAVRLIPEIYRRSASDLSDLRILDEKGTPVPYFVYNPKTITTTKENSTIPITMVDTFVKYQDTIIDYYADELPEQDLLATAISFTTNSDFFAHSVELRGSYDGVQWTFLQKDQLYQVNENQKLTLFFGEPLKYPYYRVTIQNNTEHTNLLSATLCYEKNWVVENTFTQSLVPTFTTTLDEKTTVLKLQGLKNLSIKEIQLETDDLFQRMVFYDGQQKQLYHLRFGDTLYENLILPFYGAQNREETLTIRIENGDDTPIHVKSITVTYLADELIFKGEKDHTYTLLFGQDESMAPPIYDIANYQDLILKEGVDILDIQHITTAATAPPTATPTPNLQWVFNAVVLGIAALVGYVILVRLKKT